MQETKIDNVNNTNGINSLNNNKKPYIKKSFYLRKNKNKQLLNKNTEEFLDDKEVINIESKELSEKEKLANLIESSIKAKTGIKIDLIKLRLRNYIYKYKTLDINTRSGTNIVGLCILSDNGEVLEEVYNLNKEINGEIKLPYIMGKYNLSICFSKGIEINRVMESILDYSEENKKYGINEILNSSKTLYREENIKIYLSWFNNNASIEEKEMLIKNCLKEKNKNILLEVINNKNYKQIFIDSMNNTKIEDKNFQIWLNEKLKNNIKEKINITKKDEIKENCYLSSKEDKNKLFNNMLVQENIVTVIEKRKKLVLKKTRLDNK